MTLLSAEIHMSNCYRTESGLEFAPNTTGKRYLCINYHRDGTRGKSQWAVPEPVEHSIFCLSDIKGWILANEHLWGLLNSGQSVIGTRQERIAKFPKPTNDFDAWHGYPVSNNSDSLQRHLISTQELVDAVEMLKLDGAIAPITAKRIQNGKL